MSHVATIEIEVKDLDALKRACERMGFQFVDDQKTYKWFGRFVGDSPMPKGMTLNDLGKCTHAIKVPGASYEIGVQEKDDGTFELRWDFWGSGGLEAKVGKDGGLLKQAYGIEVAKTVAWKSGYICTENVTENGTIELVLGRG